MGPISAFDKFVGRQSVGLTSAEVISAIVSDDKLGRATRDASR